MDGYELCANIKADATLADVPVILVTAMSAPQPVLHSLECDVDNSILKPYDPDYLLGRVQHVLLNRHVKTQGLI